MNVQFGKCNFDGSPIDALDLEKAGKILGTYCPEKPRGLRLDGIGMICRPLATTKEEEAELQPHQSESGVVVMWDGRIDNRRELLRELKISPSMATTDVAIVAAAYERWGMNCFGRITGEWATSIWNPHIRKVILAKDFVGTRHIFYTFENGRLTWSSVLDPLLRFSTRPLVLEEEYIAGWLGTFPRPEVTPYRSIRAVPPCCFAAFTNHSQEVSKYWDFEFSKTIRYRSDSEYEEHFRALFRESVKNRLRSNTSVLAELSGGMDSSAIVCMADAITTNDGGTPVDTVSYYDDSEPNWGEHSYFTAVEERRGRSGYHIDIGKEKQRRPFDDPSSPAWTPACDGESSEAQRQFRDCLAAGGNRAVLRGIGGDELLGGVPNPLPELADMFLACRFRSFAHELNIWALRLRRPWFHLFRDTLRLFLPEMQCGRTPEGNFSHWLTARFTSRYHPALLGYPSRIRPFGPPASFQENLFSLDALRRQLACSPAPTVLPYEFRYPYLDRELLQFLFAIPREQVIRPGERRSLMRRALRGVVPDKVLDRKRKAFVSRAPALLISDSISQLQSNREAMLLHSLDVVDQGRLLDEMKRHLSGGDVSIVPLLRALILESWLQCLLERRVIARKQSNGAQLVFSFEDGSQLRKLRERRYES